MNKLIINSDDFGYGRAINYGIIDAHQEGILTSTTLMTNTPGFEHAVKLVKENPELGVGVHLVLTFLKPLRDDVPSLTDETGVFYRPDAHRSGDVVVDVDELYKEWDTQIQTVIDAGITPTHLDSHHHAHTYNEYNYEVFLKLAKKYDLPIRGNSDIELEYSPKTTTYFEPSFDGVGMLPENDQEQYFKILLDKIKENASTEIMCHAGYVDEFLFENSSFTRPRTHQVNILTASSFVDAIKADESVELTTFADL